MRSRRAPLYQALRGWCSLESVLSFLGSFAVCAAVVAASGAGVTLTEASAAETLSELCVAGQRLKAMAALEGRAAAGEPCGRGHMLSPCPSSPLQNSCPSGCSCGTRRSSLERCEEVGRAKAKRRTRARVLHLLFAGSWPENVLPFSPDGGTAFVRFRNFGEQRHG